VRSGFAVIHGAAPQHGVAGSQPGSYLTRRRHSAHEADAIGHGPAQWCQPRDSIIRLHCALAVHRGVALEPRGSSHDLAVDMF
jgi:hypothetical protein